MMAALFGGTQQPETDANEGEDDEHRSGEHHAPHRQWAWANLVDQAPGEGCDQTQPEGHHHEFEPSSAQGHPESALEQVGDDEEHAEAHRVREGPTRDPRAERDVAERAQVIVGADARRSLRMETPVPRSAMAKSTMTAAERHPSSLP